MIHVLSSPDPRDRTSGAIYELSSVVDLEPEYGFDMELITSVSSAITPTSVDVIGLVAWPGSEG